MENIKFVFKLTRQDCNKKVHWTDRHALSYKIPRTIPEFQTWKWKSTFAQHLLENRHFNKSTEDIMEVL